MVQLSFHEELTQPFAGRLNVLLRFSQTLFLRVWSPWRVSVLCSVAVRTQTFRPTLLLESQVHSVEVIMLKFSTTSLLIV